MRSDTKMAYLDSHDTVQEWAWDSLYTSLFSEMALSNSSVESEFHRKRHDWRGWGT